MLILSAFAIPSLLIYSLAFATVHEVPAGFRSPLDEVRVFAFCLGLGLLVRLAGDAVAGASQGTGRVAPDQAWAAAGDVLFAALLLGHLAIGDKAKLDNVGICFLVSGIIAYLGRSHVSKASVGYHAPSGDPASFVERVWRRSPSFSPSAARRLLAYGGLVTLGSAADFLYAPIDYFILNRLVDPLAPAVYAPAVQVDAAILVLVSAVAIVALPSAARLAAVGNLGGVWRGYVKGSLLAGGAAVAIAIPAWWLSPQLYTLWLGDDLPATRAILPLVLVHTVLGSAAGVGRATLVALGRAKAYAVVVLLGGLLNVGLSLWFVSLGLGITGVVLGTVGSVAARCLVALPWLVWSATRERKPTG